MEWNQLLIKVFVFFFWPQDDFEKGK